MRVEGRIVQWDDAKGYGFIAPSDGGPKRFVHISAFSLRARRPFVGALPRLQYETGCRRLHAGRRGQEVRPLPQSFHWKRAGWTVRT